MLRDGRLKLMFWEDTVRRANYIYNSLPKCRNKNKVPFEVLYSEKVD